ncbi:MAG: hypothetical protein IJY41_02000 [Clostridia bacterium]|nr:hypothetical protein [Clostridia bacterium]
MSTAVIVMVAVMAFASIGMMFIAIVEFVMYMRNSRKEQQPIVITAPVAQPEPVKEPEPAPVAEPTPAPAPAIEDAVVVEDDENSVSFEVTETRRQTLKEAYDALRKVDQDFYDAVLEEAAKLELARIIESTYAVTIMQGRDNIGKLRVLRGVVTLDCTVINPDLVKYNKENGKKIKSRPTRFRIESNDELNAAIYTLKIANQTSLENRNVRKKAEKESINEQ